MEKIANAPVIEHWSYSAMMSLMRNPLSFKKRYILKIYDDNYSPSAIVGQGCHKAVEQYLNGESIEDAIAAGLALVEGTTDSAIDYGKTGSREKMLKDYTAGVQMYFDELPDWKGREILGIEMRISETITDAAGEELPLPAKCFVDVLWRSTKKETFAGKSYPKGALFITDHKFVRGYSDPDDDDPARLVQCMFNFHLVLAKLDERPAAMLYDETKLSKNRDGTPQMQTFAIDFDTHPHYFDVFYHLYRDCTKYIMREDAIFLPNFADQFDGKNSYLTYTQNLIDVETPVAVPRKKTDVAFVDKKFVPSAVDEPANKDITPEEKLRKKLLEFGIPVEMHETHSNSSVTMYTMKPSRGVRMKSIEAHSKDMALALEAGSIRVQAPIMGTSMVGVEVPNKNRSVVNYAPNPAMSGTMSIPVGIDVYGKTISKDLRDMPHCLIAGSTGSGKSVMLNVLIQSLIDQMSPEEMKLVLIDPKRVELSQFKDAPHLMSKVIHELPQAIKALKWLVDEMEERYETLDKAGARKIEDYAGGDMPYIVCVVDEFADLMLTNENAIKSKTSPSYSSMRVGELRALCMSRGIDVDEKASRGGCVDMLKAQDAEDILNAVDADVEQLIVRLAQMARAVGIHVVVATQRPTVDVVTGLIKANMPTRIAFSVSTKTDSNVILDRRGAEELVGKGDMLFLDPSSKELRRLQGFYA